MAKVAANRYAESLFELAKEMNQMEQLTEQVTAVRKVFTENPELTELLNHPKITKEEKRTVAENVFHGRVDDAVTGLLVVVIEKGRSAELPEIFEDFLAKSMEYRKVGRAFVTTAQELSDVQKKKIEDKLLAQTGYLSLEMSYTVDASLIGGMTIRIGDRVVDASIKSKLLKMASGLLKLQLENNYV